MSQVDLNIPKALRAGVSGFAIAALSGAIFVALLIPAGGRR